MFTESYLNDGAAMQKACIGGSPTQYVPPSKRQKLLQQKDILEAHLAKINAALKALDENPNLEQFINVIEQAGF